MNIRILSFRVYLFIIVMAITSPLFSQTWTESDTGIPAGFSPEDFATAPNGDVYVLCGGHVQGAFVARIYKSVNNGGLWSEVTTSGLDTLERVYTLTFSGNTLLLGGSGSVGNYCVSASTDNGATWSSSQTGIPSTYAPVDFAIAPNGNVYLLCSYYNGSLYYPKLLKSTTSGAGWSEITMSGLSAAQHATSIIFAGNKMLLSASTDTFNYVFFSTDNGDTWNLSQTGIPSSYAISDLAIAGSDIYGSATNYNGNYYTARVVKSQDSGTTWTDEQDISGLFLLEHTTCITNSGNTMLMGGANVIGNTFYIVSRQLTTGINEVNNDESVVKAYPVPFSNSLRLENDLASNSTLRITNNTGQVIYESKHPESQPSIPTELWPAGVYFVTVSNNTFTKTLKVMKAD